MEKMEHTHPHQQRHMGSELGLWESSVAGVVFPTLIFCWLDVFFFSPRCPFFFPLERKKWEGTTAAGCHAGGKKRPPLLGRGVAGRVERSASAPISCHWMPAPRRLCIDV